jgi:nitroimidazol reductase NimA-like FMN-containing flavoprotein (pyridoxamine 5'-phosphate oxidase superfamily)
MKNMDIPEDLKELFNNQRFCVLATADSGHPYTNLVSFAIINSQKTILFATRRQSNKYKNISSESRTAFFIDNRINDPDDINMAKTVTAMGNSKEVSENKSEKLKKYLDKHPYMKDFVEDPNCALMECDVNRYVFVKDFEVVKEIRLK